MRIALAIAGLVLLSACASPKPAEQAAAKPAAAPAAATQTAEAKKDCRRVKQLGSIKYKEECVTRDESTASAKAGKDSRDAARRLQDAGNLGGP